MKTLVCCLVLGIGLLAGSCDDGDNSNLDHCALVLDGDVLIGEVGAFTGTLAMFGLHLDQAVFQAVTEINQAGGLQGKTLGIVQCDTGTDATKAIAAVNELLENFSIGAIIGPVSSRCTVAITELVIERQVVTVSPVNQLPSISYLDDQGFIFRTCGSAEIQVPIIARVALDLDLSTAFVIHQDDAYGNAIHSIFKTEFEAGGGQVDDVSYLETDENYAETVKAAAQASFPPDGPGALIMAPYLEDGTIISRKLGSWNQLTGGPQWIWSNAQKDPEFFRNAGLENMIGGIGTNLRPARNEDYDRFVSAYQAMWDTPPFDFSPNMYDAVYLVAIAMALSSDPTDGVQVRDSLNHTSTGVRVGVKQWDQVLTHLAEGQMNYEGASGPVDFDENGDVLQNIQEWTVTESGAIEDTRCWQPDGSLCPEQP